MDNLIQSRRYAALVLAVLFTMHIATGQLYAPGYCEHLLNDCHGFTVPSGDIYSGFMGSSDEQLRQWTEFCFEVQTAHICLADLPSECLLYASTQLIHHIGVCTLEYSDFEDGRSCVDPALADNEFRTCDANAYTNFTARDIDYCEYVRRNIFCATESFAKYCGDLSSLFDFMFTRATVLSVASDLPTDCSLLSTVQDISIPEPPPSLEVCEQEIDDCLDMWSLFTADTEFKFQIACRYSALVEACLGRVSDSDANCMGLVTEIEYYYDFICTLTLQDAVDAQDCDNSVSVDCEIRGDTLCLAYTNFGDCYESAIRLQCSRDVVQDAIDLVYATFLPPVMKFIPDCPLLDRLPGGATLPSTTTHSEQSGGTTLPSTTTHSEQSGGATLPSTTTHSEQSGGTTLPSTTTHSEQSGQQHSPAYCEHLVNDCHGFTVPSGGIYSGFMGSSAEQLRQWTEFCFEVQTAHICLADLPSECLLYASIELIHHIGVCTLEYSDFEDVDACTDDALADNNDQTCDTLANTDYNVGSIAFCEYVRRLLSCANDSFAEHCGDIGSLFGSMYTKATVLLVASDLPPDCSLLSTVQDISIPDPPPSLEVCEQEIADCLNMRSLFSVNTETKFQTACRNSAPVKACLGRVSDSDSNCMGLVTQQEYYYDFICTLTLQDALDAQDCDNSVSVDCEIRGDTLCLAYTNFGDCYESAIRLQCSRDVVQDAIDHMYAIFLPSVMKFIPDCPLLDRLPGGAALLSTPWYATYLTMAVVVHILASGQV